MSFSPYCVICVLLCHLVRIVSFSVVSFSGGIASFSVRLELCHLVFVCHLLFCENCFI